MHTHVRCHKGIGLACIYCLVYQTKGILGHCDRLRWSATSAAACYEVYRRVYIIEVFLNVLKSMEKS